MIYTKKSLLEILEKYEDHDFLVGSLWSKFDVEYQIAEVQSDLGYVDGVTQEVINKFNASKFWDDYSAELDHLMEQDNQYYNDELYTKVLEKLKEEN